MQKKAPMGPKQALKNAKSLFHKGLMTALIGILVGLVLDAQLPGSGIPTAMILISGLAGIVVMLAGILYCWNAVRCPYCGKSLMSGYRMPTDLPHFCPDCGKDLDSCG